MSATEKKGTALIPGASSGIGAVYADRMAEREAFDAARRAMSARLSRAVPARRYEIRHLQSAGA